MFSWLKQKKTTFKNYKVKEIKIDQFRKFVEISFENFKQRVYLLSPNIFRFRATKKKKFKLDLSWSIDPQFLEGKINQQEQKIDLSEGPRFFCLQTEEFFLKIDKLSGCLEIRNRQGELVNQDKLIYFEAETEKLKVLKYANPDEYYYGLGEKASGLEHREKSFVNWNTDASHHQRGTDPFHQSFPFVLSINPKTQNHYGIFFNNSFRSYFDFCKEDEDLYSFGAEGGELDYYFFYSKDPKKIVQDYTELTGRMSLPPIWSLGYQQSRWSYETQKKVYKLVEDFKRHDIPLDAIYLDIDYLEKYRSFTFNKKTFPEFPKLIKDLLERNIKTVAIIDPGIAKDPTYFVYQEGLKKNCFVKQENQVFEGEVWPGKSVFPDFSREEVQEWWGSLYQELVKFKIKGFWNDMNEPSVFNQESCHSKKTIPKEAIAYRADRSCTNHKEIHNLYGMLMSKATFEGLIKLNPEERPFVLTRSTFAGGQKFAASWTADNTSSWDYLALWIPMVLNSGLSGLAFNGPDVGGFFESPSAELYTRFLQACSFSPFLRTHTSKFSADQEPWSFKKNFTEINRKYIKLRYELIPYTYSLFEESSRTGLPMMRPMILVYPDQQIFAKTDQQFLWGESLLIAPVLKESSREKEVLLPAQEEWFDFWTGEIFCRRNKYSDESPASWDGEKFISEAIKIEAPLEKLPIFVKANSIIPRQKEQTNSLGSAYWNKLFLDVYLSSCFGVKNSVGSIKYSLYEDDGLSFKYKNGEYSRISFKFSKPDQENLLFSAQQLSAHKQVQKKTVILKVFNLENFYKDKKKLQYLFCNKRKLRTRDFLNLSNLEAFEAFTEQEILVFEDPNKKFICLKFWLELREQDHVSLLIKAC